MLFYTYGKLTCTPHTIAKTSNQHFLPFMRENVSCAGQSDILAGDKPIAHVKTCTTPSCGGGDDDTYGRDPRIWGPHLWNFLHYSATNYPEHPSKQQIQEMITWLCSLPVAIPCPDCSGHYKKYIEENKSKMVDICSSRDKLFNFLVDIHNKVNVRNGKRVVSYEEARNLYRK